MIFGFDSLGWRLRLVGSVMLVGAAVRFVGGCLVTLVSLLELIFGRRTLLLLLVCFVLGGCCCLCC